MAYADPKIVVEDSLLTGNGYDPVRDKVLELRRQRSKEQLDVYALPTLADVPKYFAEDDLKLHGSIPSHRHFQRSNLEQITVSYSAF